MPNGLVTRATGLKRSKLIALPWLNFPNNEAAIIGFGKANLAVGQAEIAWKAFQQVLKINPGNYQALGYIAEIQEHMGQMDAAAETYLRVGNVFAGQQDIDSAIEAWLRAIELVPDKIDAHHKLAQALIQQDKIRAAVRQYLTVAAIYQNREDNERALQQIQEAQALIPNDPGIAAALEALDQGFPIQPDEISDVLLTEGAVFSNLRMSLLTAAFLKKIRLPWRLN